MRLYLLVGTQGTHKEFSLGTRLYSIAQVKNLFTAIGQCTWLVHSAYHSLTWPHPVPQEREGSGNFFYSSLLQHCRTNHSAVFCHIAGPITAQYSVTLQDQSQRSILSLSALITNFNRKLQGVKQLWNHKPLLHKRDNYEIISKWNSCATSSCSKSYQTPSLSCRTGGGGWPCETKHILVTHDISMYIHTFTGSLTVSTPSFLATGRDPRYCTTKLSDFGSCRWVKD